MRIVGSSRVECVPSVPQNDGVLQWFQSRRPRPTLSKALDEYERALRVYADGQADAHSRARAAAQLGVVDELRAALDSADLARAASVINTEIRAMGWDGSYGPSDDTVHKAFGILVDALQQARLAGRPDAGFGH
jgi:hypothetical protein